MRRIEGFTLWVGHLGDIANPRAIVETGIVAIVDLALEESPANLPRDRTYCRFPLIDGPGDSASVIRAAAETVACFLRLSTPTVVCCGAGMSRSPCIAGAAIALARRYSFDDALKLVSSSGPVDVSPGLWADVRIALG
jgi:protein-tyrosine phosphatase